MRSFYLLLFILPGLALGQQCSVPGECAGGFSIDTELVGSERECHKHCTTFEKCEWYTYDSRDGFCNVLDDCSEVDPSCTTCVHGENECTFPLMCFVPGDCSGTFIDHVDVSSPEECLEQCSTGYPNCMYFSFYPDGNVCNFYETCILDESESDVISGERDCYQASTKIFLQENNNAAWMHMPSHHGSGTTCTQPADYPLFTWGSAAQVINGSITVCGGSNSNKCYSLNSVLNVWVEFPEMDVMRYSAASVMTPAGWWITGGYNSQNSAVASTSLWDGSSWKPGHDFPHAREHHCMVQVNSTHTFVAGGGLGSITLSDAYLYDWTRDRWYSLPNMTYGRHRLACTHYGDDQGGSYIIAAGDIVQETLAQSLDLNNPGEWEKLPDLPISSFAGTFVQDDGDLILISPYPDNFLRFNPNNWTFSVIPGLTIPSSFTSDFVALAINDDLLTGCE